MRSSSGDYPAGKPGKKIEFEDANEVSILDAWKHASLHNFALEISVTVSSDITRANALILTRGNEALRIG